MKKRKLLLLVGGLSLILTVLPALASAADIKPTPTKPVVGKIVLKGITPWMADYQLSKLFFIFQEVVRERTKGELVISYLGGEEVVPPFDQFEALRNGLVDVILGVGAYYKGQVPEAGAIMLAKRPVADLRKSGYFDLLQKVHQEKGNVILLALGGGSGLFRLYSNVKLEKPDLTGLRVRVSPVYVSLVKALHGAPVMMKPSEIYQALERHVVDAYGWSVLGVTDYGWHEVTKFALDHPFYSNDTTILMNSKVWDNLPQDIRNQLKEIGREVETRWEAYYEESVAKENKKLKGTGIQFIKFSEADAKYFIDTAYEEAWKDILKACGDSCSKLKSMSE